jgi:outer membrane protein
MFAAASLGAVMVSSGAQAADLGGYKDDPVAAYNQSIWGPGWALRVRALGVLPDESSANWKVNGQTNTAALGTNPGLTIDNSLVPELDVSYFFTKNLAVELILGVTPHNVSGAGSISGQGKIGDAWLLPPTLMAQYHFELGHGIKPYVGVGVNYTVFFDQGGSANYSDFKLEDNWGFALQAGVDIPIGGNWFFNVDVKRIWLDTTATAYTSAQNPLGGGHKVTADVTVDPWLIGAGIGYKFGAPAASLK